MTHRRFDSICAAITTSIQLVPRESAVGCSLSCCLVSCGRQYRCQLRSIICAANQVLPVLSGRLFSSLLENPLPGSPVAVLTSGLLQIKGGKLIKAAWSARLPRKTLLRTERCGAWARRLISCTSSSDSQVIKPFVSFKRLVVSLGLA